MLNKKINNKTIDYKLEKIEKLILELKLDVYKKFEENINTINMLKNKIEENKILLENNKNK